MVYFDLAYFSFLYIVWYLNCKWPIAPVLGDIWEGQSIWQDGNRQMKPKHFKKTLFITYPT
jgi:hypothetical protein